MRKALALTLTLVFFWSGIAAPANSSGARLAAPDVGVDPQKTPQEWVSYYEAQMQKCAEKAYSHSRSLNALRGALDESGNFWYAYMMDFEAREYKRACLQYHGYQQDLQRAIAKAKETPTPEPSPTPVPSPTPTPIPGLEPLDPNWPTMDVEERPAQSLDELLDSQSRISKHLNQNLSDLENRTNKLLKEINDYLKKAKTAKPKPGFKVGFDSTSGPFIVSFTTPVGVVRVYLPTDMRAGDTISGTVVAEPNGQTEEGRAANRKALSGYQVVLANQKVTEPWGTFTLKMADSSPNVYKIETQLGVSLQTIELREGGSGKEMARAEIPVSTTETKATSPQTPTPNDFHLPTNGQNGRSIEIKGPFDGNLRTTDIKVGGQPVTTLAESPRSCFFQSPEQTFGPADITLKENNVQAKGTYRNLGVRLSSPKTSLLKGETTRVTIEVSGLQGIKKDVPLHLESNGVINMDGGNYQYVSIRPQDVTADGRYTTTRSITGQQVGGFGVTATVIDPRVRPTIIPLIENGGVNGYRVRKDGPGFVINVENVKHPITGDPVDGEHKLEHQCPTLAKLPYINSLFLNKGIGKAKSECLILITPRIIINEED